MKVYQAIAAVQGEMARDGIGKDRRNGQQGYNFRGIDDVYNALAPLLAKHGLCILPRVLSREQVERQSAKGGALFYTTVDCEFDFVAAEDGSKHTVRTAGEAMDSADKSTNKAMSAAYKYAAMQAFCIPTEGDNDADATTHEVMPRQQRQPERSRENEPVISDDQRRMLMTLASNAGVEARDLADRAGVTQVKDIPASKFAAAKGWLERQLSTTSARQQQRQPAPAGDILDDEVPY